MEDTGAEKQMPKYRCFKEVWALKIAFVADKGTDTTTDENPIVVITFEDSTFAPITVNLRGKPMPEAGWYYVVYPDGYKSFSPAKAFEEGYTLIKNDPFKVGNRVNFSPASGNAPMKNSPLIESVEVHNGITFFRLEGLVGALFIASSLEHV